jgi:CTP synthase (UTP-ammonia lyase)
MSDVEDNGSQPLIDACDVACAYLEDSGKKAHAMAATELRTAVRNTIANTPPDGWRDPETISSADDLADGRLLPAVVDGEIRAVRYGKTSHVPLYGWCLADQGAEEFDLCRPSLIYALPQPPEVK